MSAMWSLKWLRKCEILRGNVRYMSQNLVFILKKKVYKKTTNQDEVSLIWNLYQKYCLKSAPLSKDN